MAIDWASDHFVRLYTRETEDDLLLSWEARAVWKELLTKFDKRGWLSAKRGARTIAALIRYPVEVVERALPDLLEDGRLELATDGFLAPNYQDANYTPRSTAARKAYSRERSQIGLRPVEDSPAQTGHRPVEAVTPSHVDGEQDYEMSRDVTRSHVDIPSSDKTSIRSDQGRSEHTQSRARARSGGRRSTLSPDWAPSARERSRADELGLDCDDEAREFVAYWLSEGKAKADWDQAFAARIEQRGAQLKRQRARSNGHAEEIREIPEVS